MTASDSITSQKTSKGKKTKKKKTNTWISPYFDENAPSTFDDLLSYVKKCILFVFFVSYSANTIYSFIYSFIYYFELELFIS